MSDLECCILDPLAPAGPKRDADATAETAHAVSFFHTACWSRVLHDTYGYRPLTFTFRDKSGVAARLPFMEVKSLFTGSRAVSLPFTDYCEPFLRNGRRLQDLMPSVVAHARRARWRYLELRGGALPGARPATFYYRHVLDLEKGEDAVSRGLRGSTKRNIKKAEREGVQVRFDRTLEGMRQYFRLHCLTRKGHGLPPQPFRFFQRIHEHVIAPDKGVVVLAEHGGLPVAGGVYFTHGSQVLYKFGASHDGYLHLRPNNLVMWEAIRFFLNSGYKSLCFGRTEQENAGLRQFKLGWGPAESRVDYFRYDVPTGRFVEDPFRVSGTWHRLIGKLPIPVLKLIGSIVYKHIG